jgi:multidrug efflux pump subunit AcrB
MMMMDHAAPAASAAPSLLRRVNRTFDAQFGRLRDNYTLILAAALANRGRFAAVFLAFCALSCGLVFVLGSDFFPTVDAGLIRLHMRLPTGTRIEETARMADRVDAAIRTLIPPRDLHTILDNLGVPNSSINLSYSNAGTISSMDGEIQVSLNEGHRPTESYVEEMRRELPKRFPGVEFFFQPADMVTQILNFGLPAALDVQIIGADLRGNYGIAAKLMKQIQAVPGTVDTHIHQRLNLPAVSLVMDRTKLQELGLTATDLTQDLLVSTSGTSQVAPSFWLNPANGVVYNVTVQSPQYAVDSIDALLRTPVRSAVATAATAGPQVLSNLVSVAPSEQIAVASRYNLAPATDIYVSVQGRDTGGVANDVKRLVDNLRPELPRGAQIAILGQVQTMASSFTQLGVGLVLAIVMVYLLIVVNFQSWVDALIIISALPAALAGICWMLLLSGTTLSVPALTGAIMTMGVATANSILIVAFARQRMDEGVDAVKAALDSGATRIRPVLMTALAMIIGMIPMALGWGEGAEQNAPLGRAVIGGLLFATLSTLLFVPVVFAGIHTRLVQRSAAASGGALPTVQGN